MTPLPVQFFQTFWLNTLIWATLVTIPVFVVLLYFLKLRRRPLEVPSTYLWAKTIEDLHVNSLWQKLRQSLLLFLQLLLLFLILLACLNPGFRGAELSGDRFIFLIDTSASMQATDLGKTRLEDAKEQVANLINEMKSGDVAMIISFSNVARIEQSFTDSRSLLRQKLNRIQPTSRESELSEALRAASGLANPGQTSEAGTDDIQVADALPATLYVFSDGGFPNVPEFNLGNLEPKYIKIGQPWPDNVSVAAFSASRNAEQPGQMQAFARLENHGKEAVEVDVSLYVGTTLLDASSIRIESEGDESVQFELEETDQAILTLSVENKVKNADKLLLDNTAYTVVNSSRPARVLVVTPGNTALQRALSTEQATQVAKVVFAEPDVLETKEHQQQMAAGAYDLVIYDQCSPNKMPQTNTLFIGRMPPSDQWKKGEKRGVPIIIDTDRVHPLMQLIDLGNVDIVEAFAVNGPPGSVTLIDADLGSIFSAGPREGFVDAVMGFEIIHLTDDGSADFNTDWPIRRSFPVFILNALNYLGGQTSEANATLAKPGSSVTLRASLPVEYLEVTLPDGSQERAPREGQNRYPFTQTETLGFYGVREGNDEAPRWHFAVNLFNSRESDLRPQEKIELGYYEVKEQGGYQPKRVDGWKWILIAALALLMIEWYIFNRRVYL